jgi:hypothetical protein
LSCRGNQRFQTTEIRAISDPELVLDLPFDDTAVAVFNIKLQLDIVSFFDIDFDRPAEVLADQCAGP